ncbi:MAG TPA: type IV secretory system conjugative DNA transfer family protein [Oscillospiraceae bacterium]|nr:type IV secretory system conjugative DNA transfer family protein [Oscillospiraceae bacterium]
MNILKKLLLWVLLLIVFFFCSFAFLNILINYSVLFLTSIKLTLQGVGTDGYFGFTSQYLYTLPETISIFYSLVAAALMAIFILFKIQRFLPRLTNKNKDIHGSGRWATSTEIKKYLTAVPEDDITQAAEGGITLARQNGKLYIDTQTVNSLIVGTTRSGKGQTFVLPMIRMITQARNKQSLVINDPKGELLENSYASMKAAGYEIVALNFRETKHSSLWNPLHIIIQEYIKCMESDEQDISRTAELIGELARIITYNAQSDPIWPTSAKSLLSSLIFYLLDVGYKHDCLDKLNMYSVYTFFIEYGSQNYVVIRNGAQLYVNALDELFKELSPGDPAKLSYATSNFATGDMRGSIFSTLASNLEIFSDTGIARLTSGNQIDFEKLIHPDKPCAIFMVVPDEKENRHLLASLFVNQCYSYLVDLANNYPQQRLPQRIQFILDEFGNMVRIPSMDVKVTVCLGRNILFSLFVQDLKQLDSKYKDTAATIRSNCGNLIYINSLDKDTNEYISRVLGQKTIEFETSSGKITDVIDSQTSTHYQGRALMTPDEHGLQMQFGEAVVIRQRCYPIHTKFEPYYKLRLPITPMSEIPTGHNVIDLNNCLFPFEKVINSVINDNNNENEPESKESLLNRAIKQADLATGGEFLEKLGNNEYDGCRRLIGFLQLQNKMKRDDIRILLEMIDAKQ